MQRKVLGRTGLNLSILSVGTVELGMNYGITVSKQDSKPSKGQSSSIIKEAINSGINYFDTASSYGDSETILGETLSGDKDTIVATKFNVPVDDNGNPKSGKELYNDIFKSVEKSIHNLNCQYLDILQIHNATIDIIEQGDVIKVLKEAQKLRMIKFIGASVYGEKDANSVISDGSIDVLQVAYNILDQRMSEKVLIRAAKENMGIILRSVYLKGALTKKADSLPNQLIKLKEHVIELKKKCANNDWDTLTDLALRFCLGNKLSSSVLVGISSMKELSSALKSVNKGALSRQQIETLSEYSMDDDLLLNPSKWVG